MEISVRMRQYSYMPPIAGLFVQSRRNRATSILCRCCSLLRVRSRMDIKAGEGQLWLILGDGVNQAADLASGAASIPSWNLTPWMTFGN